VGAVLVRLRYSRSVGGRGCNPKTDRVSTRRRRAPRRPASRLPAILCADSRSLAVELARSLGRRRLALVTDSGVAMAQTLALQASACGVNVDVFHGESAALTCLDDPDAL
jgi:hypothetical protein